MIQSNKDIVSRKPPGWLKSFQQISVFLSVCVCLHVHTVIVMVHVMMSSATKQETYNTNAAGGRGTAGDSALRLLMMIESHIFPVLPLHLHDVASVAVDTLLMLFITESMEAAEGNTAANIRINIFPYSVVTLSLLTVTATTAAT